MASLTTKGDSGEVEASIAVAAAPSDSPRKQEVANDWPPFYGDLHRKYVRELGENKDSYEYQVTEHLRLSGIYWGFGAMALLNAEDEMDPGAIKQWVVSSFQLDKDSGTGGWGGNTGHDIHLLYTCSAVQLLAMTKGLQEVPHEPIVVGIAKLQQPDGSFAGDEWLEIDTRFSYCALLTLAILGRLDAVDVKAATDFVSSCQNFDGGYGCVPGAESHAGQIFCCVGALSIGGALEEVDRDKLSWWLCERQCDSGGLNGRPEKQADVCYSWWVLSVLAILGRLDWIDQKMLTGFILSCQNEEDGGIADRPGDMADVFHTFFGICGLSFLGYFRAAGIPHKEIDPTFAMPCETVERLNLKCETFFKVPGK